jgi:pyruvate/2-oxoglutarate dehydrogenase complex dihydrolipoamide acyltransferase (E2) component
MITIDIPIAPMHDYINAKRKEGLRISHLALVLASYVRTAAEYPHLNRFIGGSNHRIYAHKDFSVSMVVLRPGTIGGTSIKLHFDFTDTIFDINKKIEEAIEKNRDAANDNNLDKFMRVLLGIPGFARGAVALLRFLDRHGWLPAPVCEISPFHASLLITNLASIRTNHIYHHVYDFGTTSVAIAMGNLRDLPKKSKNGIVLERHLPMGVVMDERICNGHYFATAFSRMKEYLKDPTLLEGPPRYINPEI